MAVLLWHLFYPGQMPHHRDEHNLIHFKLNLTLVTFRLKFWVTFKQKITFKNINCFPYLSVLKQLFWIGHQYFWLQKNKMATAKVQTWSFKMLLHKPMGDINVHYFKSMFAPKVFLVMSENSQTPKWHTMLAWWKVFYNDLHYT